jgi:hypothetical protein
VALPTAPPQQQAHRGEHFEIPPAEPSGRGRAGLPGGSFGWLWVGLVSALATLLSWRTDPWRPVFAGLSSWQEGLALGFAHHLQWGPQVIFTFGPYGFVEDILSMFWVTAALGLAYVVIITWGLAALIVAALRKPWGLLPAGVAAWASVTIAANLLEAPELALATALGLALASLRATSERGRLGLLGALGALAGFQLLVEINVGIVTAALAVLTIVGATAASPGAWRQNFRVRAALVAAVPFLVVLVAALVAAGQSLGNFASYVRGSSAVALGYAPAMGSSAGRQAEDWYAVVDVVLLAGIFALSLVGRPVREKAAISLMLAGWTWEAMKEGFVRHDLHDLTFFGLFVVALCLARLPRLFVPVQAGAIALAAFLACTANGGLPPSLHSPREAARALEQEVRALVVPSRWLHQEAVAREQARINGGALAPGLVSSLQGYSVANATYEDSLAVAYPQLRWDPLPVLQSYSAYTTYLDDLDASFLSSGRAPQRLLYEPATIDLRDPYWDPPATLEAMYCHYNQIGISEQWQVLARVPDRCGDARVIGVAKATFGQPIAVPAAGGEMEVATFRLSSPLWARAEGVLLKPPQVHMTTWALGTGKATTYRFIAGTAADVHVLAAPTSLGYSPEFAPPTVVQLQVSGGGWSLGQGSVRVTFLAVPMSRPASGP